MFCKKCGKELKSSYKFCPQCGCTLNQVYPETKKESDLAIEKHTELRANIFDLLDVLKDQWVKIFNNELQGQIANGEKVPLFYPTIKSLYGNSKRILVEFRTFSTIRLIIFNFDFPNQRVAKGDLYMFIVALDIGTNVTSIFEIINENDKDGLVIEYNSNNIKKGRNLIVKLNDKTMIRSIFGIIKINNNDNLLITKEQKKLIETRLNNFDLSFKSKISDILNWDNERIDMFLMFLQNNGALYHVYDESLTLLSKTIFVNDSIRLSECLELISIMDINNSETSSVEDDFEFNMSIDTRNKAHAKYKEIYQIEIEASFENLLNIYENFDIEKVDQYTEKYIYEYSVICYLFENYRNALKYASIAAERESVEAMNFYAYLTLKDQFNKYKNNGFDLRKTYFIKATSAGSFYAKIHLMNFMNIDETGYFEYASKHNVSGRLHELLKDEQEMDKLSRMFGRSFKSVFREDYYSLDDINCTVYRFRDEPINSMFGYVGTFSALAILDGAETRYFALEKSYGEDVLCEWKFDGEKEVQHLNYGGIGKKEAGTLVLKDERIKLLRKIQEITHQ